ncbi:hypothetical protein Ahy_A08g039996 [Arachis hypogaea]|uniref:Uncharacterized protein n=1 Tax=Arachis hypogaea TaxID=3818 RepID=A0A445BYH8_ARAHY|nr:hypothetical protein Ahy_A08g039996 [Arachis hypogaea]
MPKKDLHIKQAATLVVKLEENSLFSSENIFGAASKYSEVLSLCPMKSKKERVVLYSNRAQCHLLLQQPFATISNATHALCFHKPLNRHAKSLWRRAQAYDMLGQLLSMECPSWVVRVSSCIARVGHNRLALKLEKTREENRREEKHVSTMEMVLQN